ncbi:MAG: cytochrome B [Rhodocyclaceae bacterium]|nr:cytochrome B [Rhodocyclaceae bacterium]
MCVGIPGAPRRSDSRVRVWDLPTRLFHWSLLALVVAAFVTGEVGGNAMIWHGRAGLGILGLVVFRLVWGFVGSTYARFSHFVRGPGAIRAYLAGQWRGLGHNPLGALSVLGLLAVVAFQAGTGLFANDDIAFRGPLQALVSDAVSNQITGWHHLGKNLMIALVVLHVGAVAFYVRVKKHNLLKPMILGWTEGEGDDAQGGGIVPLLIALAVACLAVTAAAGVFLPPPEVGTTAPAW